MNKEEAKRKLQAGEIQIYFDDKNKLVLLNWLYGFAHTYYTGTGLYYCIKTKGLDRITSEKPIIKISEIMEDDEEVIWKIEDMEFRIDKGQWLNMGGTGSKVEYRLKPKPDFTKEIEALQNKAKENGMKAVINFEKV